MRMTPNPPIAAIILAGGRSSRMGRDKALLEISGRSLLEKISRLALECTDRVYIITPWIERYQSILPNGCQMIREVVSPGETEPQGPLVGFARALTEIDAEWVLLLACDLPNLNASVFKNQFDDLDNIPPEVMAWLPRHPKGWEPLCGFYRRQCLPLLEEFIDRGGRSFQGWLALIPVRELPLSDRGMLFNCNTPEDLKRLEKW